MNRPPAKRSVRIMPALRVLVVSAFLVAKHAAIAASAPEAPKAGHTGPACGWTDDFFVNEVWTKVASRSCLECHKEGGDAEDTKLVLRDPLKDTAGREAALQHNRAAFARLAAKRNRGESRLLLKVVGELEHGGEDVVKKDSTEYRLLQEFVRLADPATVARPVASAEPKRQGGNLFDGVTMLDDRRLFRRLTLSLAGRLPRPEELQQIEKSGLTGVSALLDGVMREEAFFDRLGEAFNDILLIRGYTDGAETALSYDHFSKTRHWTQKHDLNHIADEKERQKARYKLADDYREALLREPLELIKHIVREERPFTEIVTADYIMMSPYTSRGYGIFEEVRGRFKKPDDPYEFVPVRLPSLKHRDGRGHQQSETGFYPHAGILSTFQYLRRYPTTETNRNRLRGRMFYQHFLGVDVLELAARVTDAAAATAKFEVPTMQAAECVVCHKTLDPVSGLFQDYYSFEGVFGPRKEGWFKDMFGPGFEGENMPAEQRWRALQWLGERTAKDPRFARTMVEHAWQVLSGRRALLPPKGIDDPLFDAKHRAYAAQQREIDRIAGAFVKANYSLKEAFKQWAVSPFYRADGVTTTKTHPERQAELADIGVARMLGPEQLERKVAAIFEKPWGRLKDKQYALLYGGIDSEEVTERAADPSGAMGALQRMMANDVACKNVSTDFAKPAGERRLFPAIELDVVPGESPEKDQRLRAAVAHLHQLVLGRADTPDSAEVARTYGLFAGILEEAREHKEIEPVENYTCRSSGPGREGRDKDPHYTIRAWRGVVTYLLRQRDFLYE